MHKRILMGSAVLTIMMGSVLHAKAQQHPCMADAFRVCYWNIPNAERIAACLLSHWAILSPQCQSFMANYGQEQGQGREQGRLRRPGQ